MIRADEDVMNAGWNEPAHDGHHPLAGTGEVLHSRPPAVENRLRAQRVGFVHVEERLVIGIVRKERGGHDDRKASGEESAAGGGVFL